MTGGGEDAETVAGGVVGVSVGVGVVVPAGTGRDVGVAPVEGVSGVGETWGVSGVGELSGVAGVGGESWVSARPANTVS